MDIYDCPKNKGVDQMFNVVLNGLEIRDLYKFLDQALGKEGRGIGRVLYNKLYPYVVRVEDEVGVPGRRGPRVMYEPEDFFIPEGDDAVDEPAWEEEMDIDEEPDENW